MNYFITKSLFYLSLILVFMPYVAQAKPKTNPDISLNVLLLGKTTFSGEEHGAEHNGHGEDHSDDHSIKTPGSENHHHHDLKDGFFIQEVELYFKSNIDPYWSGDIYLGVSKHDGHVEVELEEVFVESLFIPNVTLKVGKFYALLGRHNNLHTHYYPFIDPPLMNQALFGMHGYSETGVSLAYLSPLPWYSELVAQVFWSSEAWWSSDLEDKISGILFFKNVWDLNSNSTLEFNVSYGMGVKGYRHLADAALVLKGENLYSGQDALSWTTETLLAMENGEQRLKKEVQGISSYIQWKFVNNWWLEGRSDYLLSADWDEVSDQKYSVLLAFAATEYSALRLQYDLEKKDHREGWAHGLSIQLNMSLGTHPAHLY